MGNVLELSSLLHSFRAPHKCDCPRTMRRQSWKDPSGSQVQAPSQSAGLTGDSALGLRPLLPPSSGSRVCRPRERSHSCLCLLPRRITSAHPQAFFLVTWPRALPVPGLSQPPGFLGLQPHEEQGIWSLWAPPHTFPCHLLPLPSPPCMPPALAAFT